MKKILSMIMAFTLAVSSMSCGLLGLDPIKAEPQVSQMKAIFELAVMECYYHNVAKYSEEDAAGIWWWKKDKKFWIEYSGVITLGIDVSRVNIEVEDSLVTISIPEAEIQGARVDSSSLSRDSFIVDKDSADIDAEDEIYAFGEAQMQLEEAASNDKALLAEAQQRAKILLEDYVTNIGAAVGKEYTVDWIYLGAEESTEESIASED